MKFIGKFIFHILSNAAALLITAHFVEGFILNGDAVAILTTALVLTLLNTFIRPILKLFFGPFIVLTFGLFSIVINALTLHFLDIWSIALTIQGYVPLLWGTVIVSIVNIAFSIPEKLFFRK